MAKKKSPATPSNPIKGKLWRYGKPFADIEIIRALKYGTTNVVSVRPSLLEKGDVIQAWLPNLNAEKFQIVGQQFKIPNRSLFFYKIKILNRTVSSGD